MSRSGDGLYLRNSTWYLDFRHKGERHTMRLGRNISKTVAREIASVKRGQIVKGEAGIATSKNDLVFDKAVDLYLEWVDANKRPKTIKCYKEYIKQLRRTFGGKRLSAIHPFLIERHKRMRVGEDAKVALNRELAILKALFNKCILWRKFDGPNPAREVKKLEESKGRLRYLEPEEEGALLNAAGEPLRTLIVVGLYTGLRLQSEALTLEWQDVNLNRGMLTVQAAYAKNGESRMVPLNSLVKKAFEEMRRKAGTGAVHVFAKADGSPYKSIRTAFETACRRANLTGVTLHTLRHTFGSRLAMSGVDLRTIQELGGWGNLDMVQRYSHLSPNHKAEAVERIVETFHNVIHNTEENANFETQLSIENH